MDIKHLDYVSHTSRIEKAPWGLKGKVSKARRGSDTRTRGGAGSPGSWRALSQPAVAPTQRMSYALYVALPCLPWSPLPQTNKRQALVLGMCECHLVSVLGRLVSLSVSPPDSSILLHTKNSLFF